MFFSKFILLIELRKMPGPQQRPSTSAVDNSSTWSEMIRAIEREKKSLPWNPSDVQPVKKIDLYEVMNCEAVRLDIGKRRRFSSFPRSLL